MLFEALDGWCVVDSVLLGRLGAHRCYLLVAPETSPGNRLKPCDQIRLWTTSLVDGRLQQAQERLDID